MSKILDLRPGVQIFGWTAGAFGASPQDAAGPVHTLPSEITKERGSRFQGYPQSRSRGRTAILSHTTPIHPGHALYRRS